MSLTKFQGSQAVPHKIELSAWFRLPFEFLFAAWTYIIHSRTRFLLKCQARRKKEQREQKAIGALCADRCIQLFVPIVSCKILPFEPRPPKKFGLERCRVKIFKIRAQDYPKLLMHMMWWYQALGFGSSAERGGKHVVVFTGRLRSELCISTLKLLTMIAFSHIS